jgi:glutaminase
VTDSPRDPHAVLVAALHGAQSCSDGEVATYIPELGGVEPDRTSAALVLRDGTVVAAGDPSSHRFTLQSAAKLIVLAGALHEFGPQRVFEVVGSEPSGDSFSSMARLESRGPRPANPMVNAGAIALCSLLPGELEDRIAWIETWAQRLCGTRLTVNSRVQASEARTGDRNRSIAYLLRATGVLQGTVDDALQTYFALCSLEATVVEAARLGCVLARGGMTPQGERVVDADAATRVVALMASCGMYDESGTYLMETGLPAKSGVSGVIIGVAPGQAGIAVCSPRLNSRGGSVRGHMILRTVSRALHLHFAAPETHV